MKKENNNKKELELIICPIVREEDYLYYLNEKKSEDNKLWGVNS